MERAKIILLLFIATVLCYSFIQPPQNPAISPATATRLDFINKNVKYDSKLKIHKLSQQLLDSIQMSYEGHQYFNIMLGLDSTTIKKALGEPHQNWLYTYRYFLDSCCYNLSAAECSFSCNCITLKISPEGRCTSFRIGKYLHVE